MIFNKIFSKKIIFKTVVKSDLILLDKNYANLKFEKIHSHLFNPDEYYYKEFLKSLRIYFKSFFKISFSQIYFKQLINKLDPKVAVGNEMDHRIFDFKKFYPKKIAICYQFGYIFKNDINYYKKRYKNKKVDYFFAYDLRSKAIMSKLINARYYINGSTKVNENLPIKNNKKKYDIVFISRARFPKKQIWKNFNNEYDKFLIKTISKYCKDHNLQLTIAFNSMRKDKKNRKGYFLKEKNFYDSVIQEYEIGKEDSFSLSHKSKLVICHNSNLGYELLFSECKVVFIDSLSCNFNYFNSRKGPFWYYGNNTTKIVDLISSIFFQSDKMWLKEVKKINKDLVKFYNKKKIYYNNAFFKNKLKKFV